MTLPKDLPKYGTLDGERILLEDVAKLHPSIRSRVVVETDKGPIRPWRFISEGDEVTFNDDGSISI